MRGPGPGMSSDALRPAKPRPRFRPERPTTRFPTAKPRRSSPARGLVAVLIVAVLTVWAVAATWVAFTGRQTIAALTQEQAELRAAYEEKVKALTRRLVGVASHQILEQDGLEGRMADLITRQVQLENRQAMLSVFAEQASNAPFAPAEAAKPADPAGAGGARMRGGELGGGAAPSPRLGPAPGGRPFSELPLREQFARLEQSMDRVQSGQVRSLDGLVRMSQGQIALVRAAFAELGLDLDKLAPGAAKTAMGGPFVPLAAARDPFELGFQQLQRARAVIERLRPVTEIVPLRRPIEGENLLTSNFGPRSDPFTGATAMHAGMDFRSPNGTPVRAAGLGRVVTAEASGGYGNLVELDHGQGIVTRYAHLSEISVSRGQMVPAGGVVGLVGSTGRSTGPHLHYETRIAGGAVDPMRFLRVGTKLFAPREKQEQLLQATTAPESEAADD